MKGFMYILECANGYYYTGSTNDLDGRIEQHLKGEGAIFTKKYLPVKLVYFEEFQSIEDAFYREKQVQGWSRKKKEALINGFYDKLPDLSLSYRDVASRSSATERSSATTTSAYEDDETIRRSIEMKIITNRTILFPIDTEIMNAISDGTLILL